MGARLLWAQSFGPVGFRCLAVGCHSHPLSPGEHAEGQVWSSRQVYGRPRSSDYTIYLAILRNKDILSHCAGHPQVEVVSVSEPVRSYDPESSDPSASSSHRLIFDGAGDVIPL